MYFHHNWFRRICGILSWYWWARLKKIIIFNFHNKSIFQWNNCQIFYLKKKVKTRETPLLLITWNGPFFKSFFSGFHAFANAWKRVKTAVKNFPGVLNLELEMSILLWLFFNKTWTFCTYRYGSQAEVLLFLILYFVLMLSFNGKLLLIMDAVSCGSKCFCNMKSSQHIENNLIN